MSEEKSCGDHEESDLFVKEFTQYFFNQHSTEVVKIILNFDEVKIEDRFTVLVGPA